MNKIFSEFSNIHSLSLSLSTFISKSTPFIETYFYIYRLSDILNL